MSKVTTLAKGQLTAVDSIMIELLLRSPHGLSLLRS
jgi:hypothetical protein